MKLRGLFITGTDTGVGKTHVAVGVISALRCRGVRVGAYKPAVSGSIAVPGGRVWEDLERLQSAVGDEFPADRICPQRFHAPLAPPVAAEREGKQVDAALLHSGIDWWRERTEFVVVEGAGGLLSPLSNADTVADVAASIGFPLLIVSRLSLGTINHTLLTLEAARARGLLVAGIVLNQPIAPNADDLSVETNPNELTKRCGVPILAILPHVSTTGLLQDSPLFTIDWMQVTLHR